MSAWEKAPPRIIWGRGFEGCAEEPESGGVDPRVQCRFGDADVGSVVVSKEPGILDAGKSGLSSGWRQGP